MAGIEFSHARPALDLKAFEERFHIPLKATAFRMENTWAELLQYALHLEGPDISEVGMTWLGSLAGMQVLRAFRPNELREIRRQGNFVEATWENCQYEGEVLGIPWHLDTRLFFYRRDIFEKLGIDGTTAFASIEQVKETLVRLKAAGFEYPWAVTTKGNVLQYLAPWVWGNGGSFRSRDGRIITLTEPEAMQGLLAYFDIVRMLAPDTPDKEDAQLESDFFDGKVPIFYNGDWFYREVLAYRPNLVNVLGAAKVPGSPYLGSMYISIWRHTIYIEECLTLIRYLTDRATIQEFFEKYRLTPSITEILYSSAFTSDPICKAIAESIQHGRPFKNNYRWAGVENRLNSVFSQLMKDVVKKPEMDLPGELYTRMNGIKLKLERTILA